MVKITDVAKLAGVSPSTVSHVLNGKRPISEPTRNRVLQAIEELNYIPNANARAMKSGHTGIIGFVAADITEYFSNRIIQGVESVFVPYGFHLLFVSGTEFKTNLGDTMAFLNSRKLDGAIISQSVTQDHRSLEFSPPEFPLLTVNFDYGPHLPRIILDNYRGGWEAAEHLARKGFSRAGLIMGPADRIASNDRQKGFLDGADNFGLTIAQKKIINVPFDFQGGVKGMEELLKSSGNVDSVFCANDYIAVGAIHAAEERGMGVPDDIGVVGFDNRDFSAFWPTPVTSFDQPLYDMGKMAARYLQDRILGGQEIPIQTVLSSRLIERDSTRRSGADTR